MAGPDDHPRLQPHEADRCRPATRPIPVTTSIPPLKGSDGWNVLYVMTDTLLSGEKTLTPSRQIVCFGVADHEDDCGGSTGKRFASAANRRPEEIGGGFWGRGSTMQPRLSSEEPGLQPLDQACFTSWMSRVIFTSLLTRIPPVSSAWFHSRPNSRRSILVLAVKLIRSPPQGSIP